MRTTALFVNEEHVGGGFIKRVFPEAPNGDLFAGGWDAKTNTQMPNKDKLKAFWARRDIASMSAVIDLEASVTEWAAEALLNDADGYWGGAHNFYLYDYPGKGYRWLLDDVGATFAWLRRSNDHRDLPVDDPLRRRSRSGSTTWPSWPIRPGGRPTSTRSGSCSRAGTSRACRGGSTPGTRRSPTRWSRIRTAAAAWRITARRSRRCARRSSIAPPT